MKKWKAFGFAGLVMMLLFSMSVTALAKDHGHNGKMEIKLEFKDAKEAEWAAAYIGKMKSKKVLSGYPDGTFRPNAAVKRVEAITAAVRLMGLEEEAKAVPENTELLFEDAHQIESWAVGYVKVALEQGLFDEMETQVQPEKAASRLWVSSLLVKALGLQEEALELMNEAPDFTDRQSIPAGSVGYVNAAVEEGIVSGYPDGTFQPHKAVTRAELATLLDRTHLGLLEQEGAITVSGIIESVDFTVTDEVYGNGTLTLRTFSDDVQSFTIQSDLPVLNGQTFIPADQLVEGDVITLVAEEGVVIEAALVQEDSQPIVVNGIVKLEYKAEFVNGDEFKLEYQNRNGKVSGEIKAETESDAGASDMEIITEILTSAALDPNMSVEEILAALQQAVEHTQEMTKELKLEVHFANGMKMEWKSESKDHDDEANSEEEDEGRKNDLGQKQGKGPKEGRGNGKWADKDKHKEDEEDQDETATEAYPGIHSFELKLELQDESMYSLTLKSEKGEVQAKVESDLQEEEMQADGVEALWYITTLLDELALDENVSEANLRAKVLAALGVQAEDVEELEIEVEFVSGTEVEID